MLLLYFTDVEFVIVGNGVADDVARNLTATVNATPDSAALFLAQRVDPDVARLIGMENAVSDFVLLTTPNDAELSVLASLLDSYRARQRSADRARPSPAARQAGLPRAAEPVLPDL